MSRFNEDTVELAAIDWLRQVGYDYVHGGDIAPGEPAAERASYNEVLLLGRLRAALERINGHIPRAVRASVVDEVIRRIQRTPSQNPVVNNHAFHRLLTEGVDVSYRDGGQMIAQQSLAAGFRQSRRERVPGGQPVHGDGHQPHVTCQNQPPPGCGLVRQRPAAGHHRTQECRRCQSRPPDGLQSASDLQERHRLDLHLQRPAGGQRWHTGPAWHAHCRREWFKPWRTVDGSPPRSSPHAVGDAHQRCLCTGSPAGHPAAISSSSSRTIRGW